MRRHSHDDVWNIASIFITRQSWNKSGNQQESTMGKNKKDRSSITETIRKKENGGVTELGRWRTALRNGRRRESMSACCENHLTPWRVHNRFSCRFSSAQNTIVMWEERGKRRALLFCGRAAYGSYWAILLSSATFGQSISVDVKAPLRPPLGAYIFISLWSILFIFIASCLMEVFRGLRLVEGYREAFASRPMKPLFASAPMTFFFFSN